MYEYREELLENIEKFQVMIVTAETGSGKTTQVSPLFSPVLFSAWSGCCRQLP